MPGEISVNPALASECIAELRAIKTMVDERKVAGKPMAQSVGSSAQGLADVAASVKQAAASLSNLVGGIIAFAEAALQRWEEADGAIADALGGGPGGMR